MDSPKDFNKRHFLFSQLPLALGLVASSRIAHAELEKADNRNLYLYNLHTQERLECWYYSDGQYLPRSLDRINNLFRDHRTEEQHPIDVNLLNTLFLLSRQFSTDAPIEVLSGFRSASTNEMLRRKSQGVAKRSYHMVGQAVDCRFPGVTVERLRDEALHAARGGVGYYPKSNFVHLDSGPVRRW